MAMCIITATIFVLMVASLSHPASAASASRNKNGVRLVLESGSRGRIEISTKDPAFPGISGSKTVWMPVCASTFDDGEAEYMCKLLGYKTGRVFNSAKVAFTTAPAYRNTASRLICNEKPASAGRRALRGGGGAADGVDVATALVQDGVEQGKVAAHRELSYRLYQLNTPAKGTNISCRFFVGDCDPAAGPFAGVECSNTPMPPAPPPPPSPPSPPSYWDSIRLVGPPNWMESNLCPSEDFCRQFGRVEVKVPAPDGDIWAPLCAVEDQALRGAIADIACQQAYGWPRLMRSPPVLVFYRTPVEDPFNITIPTGAVDASAGDFDPNSYQAWVKINSVRNAQPTMLQDGNYTVSQAPCGELFAVRCEALYARHRR